jgi:mono/diheme cytochrome c family protein
MRARFCAVALFLLAVSPAAHAAGVPDLDRGRLLYENHCQVCHTPNIHRRAKRLPLNATELRVIVDQWQQEEKLGWSAQDIDDVVQFLRQTRYRF